MKVKVNYDFVQQELAGKTDVFEIREGTSLGELLRTIDSRIIESGKNKGIDTTYMTSLSGCQLNGCMVFVNGEATSDMLDHELHDGDIVDFVYGFCGG